MTDYLAQVVKQRDTARTQLRAAIDEVRAAAQELRERRARDERVRQLASDMRDWCSPHGIAIEYAERLQAAIDGPGTIATALAPQPLPPSTLADQLRVTEDELGKTRKRAGDLQRQLTRTEQVLAAEEQGSIRELTAAIEAESHARWYYGAWRSARRWANTWRATLGATLDELKTTQAALDGAYRERAHLIAWLAAQHPAVLAPAPDVDEAGWQILYLTAGGRQLSWHIHPRDAELYGHVERVAAADPRAEWDGHTTDEKYEAIRELTGGQPSWSTSPGEFMVGTADATLHVYRDGQWLAVDGIAEVRLGEHRQPNDYPVLHVTRPEVDHARVREQVRAILNGPGYTGESDRDPDGECPPSCPCHQMAPADDDEPATSACTCEPFTECTCNALLATLPGNLAPASIDAARKLKRIYDVILSGTGIDEGTAPPLQGPAITFEGLRDVITEYQPAPALSRTALALLLARARSLDPNGPDLHLISGGPGPIDLVAAHPHTLALLQSAEVINPNDPLYGSILHLVGAELYCSDPTIPLGEIQLRTAHQTTEPTA